MSFTIDVFRNMLRINKHRLDDELEIQAELQERISAHTARLNSRMLECKKGLDAEEARVIAQLKDNDAKLTNPQAEKEARRHRDYISAWQSYAVARQEHEEWLGLYEAWKSRGYQLKTLADLFSDQYFTIDSAGTPSRSYAGPDPSAARAAMRRSVAEAARQHTPEKEEATSSPATPLRRRIIT